MQAHLWKYSHTLPCVVFGFSLSRLPAPACPWLGALKQHLQYELESPLDLSFSSVFPRPRCFLLRALSSFSFLSVSCACTLQIPASLLQAPKFSPSFQGLEAGIPSWRYESFLLQFISPYWVATEIMKNKEGSKHIVRISLLGAFFLLCEPLWSSCSRERWSRFIDRWTNPRDVCDFLRPILEPGLETVLPGPKFKRAGGYHCIVWILHEREAHESPWLESYLTVALMWGWLPGNQESLVLGSRQESSSPLGGDVAASQVVPTQTEP